MKDKELNKTYRFYDKRQEKADLITDLITVVLFCITFDKISVLGFIALIINWRLISLWCYKYNLYVKMTYGDSIEQFKATEIKLIEKTLTLLQKSIWCTSLLTFTLTVIKATLIIFK